MWKDFQMQPQYTAIFSWRTRRWSRACCTWLI